MMKSFRLFLGTIALIFSHFVVAQEKPNVLIIHTDEHSFKTIGKYRELDMGSGNISNEDYYNPWAATENVPTPNLDRIGEEGAVSTKHYATSPTCTPSRASLMTGRYPFVTGAARNDRPMHGELKTFADAFKENGYSTAYVGKWHLEGKDDPETQVWGAGRNFGFDNIEWRIEKEHWTWYDEDGNPPYNWGENGKPGDGWIYATEFYTNKAIEIMEQDVDNGDPFCLMISIPDPHTPNHSAPEYQDWCRNVDFQAPYTYEQTYVTPEEDEAGIIKRPHWANDRNNNDVWHGSQRYAEFDEFYMQEYWGMLSAVDDNVGRMLDFLEEKGQLDNTIIVYSSDHGDMLFEMSRINKGLPYDGSAKLPFLIRYPKKIDAGKIVTTPHTNADVGQTLLALADLPSMDDIDGQDKSELFTRDQQMVTDEDTVLIVQDGNWWMCVATERYKLVLNNKEEPYLIDMVEDPLELDNQLSDKDAANYDEYYQIALKLEDNMKRQVVEKGELYGAGFKFLMWMTEGPEIPPLPSVPESELPLDATLFGFEGPAIVDGTAKRWTLNADYHEIVDTKAYSGDHSLKFSYNSPLAANASLHAPGGVVRLADGYYTFKAKMFVEPGSGLNRFRLNFKNPSKSLDPFDVSNVRTGEWVEVAFNFDMLPGTTSEGTFSLVIQPGDTDGGSFAEVYFDDIEIEERIPLQFTGLDPVLYGFEGSAFIDGTEKNWTLGNGAAYSREEMHTGQRSLDLSDVSNITSSVTLAAHSPVKSLYMNQGDYKLNVRVKAKENNRVNTFDIILKDNMSQSLYIIHQFDISGITEADGWVTLSKNFTFNKESDPSNGQITIRVRESDLNPSGTEEYFFIDDIELIKFESDNGGEETEVAKDVPNAEGDINLVNSHLHSFEGPTLLDLNGDGTKTRVDWISAQAFSIVEMNGAPHGKRVMRFTHDAPLSANQSTYLEKLSAPLPNDKDLEFSMKVYKEEGSTINTIRLINISTAVNFDISSIAEGEWVTLKTVFKAGTIREDLRVNLQVQTGNTGDHATLYIDDIRIIDPNDIEDGGEEEGCVSNPSAFLNSCNYGFEEQQSEWSNTSGVYTFTDEKSWGGNYSIKAVVDEVIATGNKNLSPKTSIQQPKVMPEDYVISMKVWIDENCTLDNIATVYKYDVSNAQTDLIALDELPKNQWVTVMQNQTLPAGDDIVLEWVGLRFNKYTVGTGTMYVDDFKVTPLSEYVPEEEKTVTITVKDEEDQAVDGAEISTSNFDNLMTDMLGEAELMISAVSNKVFTVMKDGYNTITSAFTVENDDVSVNVVMKEKTSDFMVEVSDLDGQIVQGATVILNESQTQLSDVRGLTVFQGFSVGTVIDYKVSLADFKEVTGQYITTEEHKTMVVQLEKMIYAPVSDFEVNRTTGELPLVVRFTDLSENDPTEWAWDFGDGNTSTEKNPFHTYETAGEYTVQLTTKNVTGESTETKEAYVIAGNPVVSDFTTDVTSGTVPLTVQFTDQSTNTPTSWAWDFGDESTSNEQNPTHIYTEVGTYTVKLMAQNADGGNEIVKEDLITVNQIPAPTAAFSVNTEEAILGDPVRFTDESTETPTSWAWDFGDGNTSEVQNPTHTYAALGEYTVTLTVQNAGGESTETKENFVTVIEEPLEAPIADFEADPTTGKGELTVQFTDLSIGEIVSWFWNFGDGNTSEEQNPKHTYTEVGQYDVSLKVSNEAGDDTKLMEDMITVESDAPTSAELDRLNIKIFPNPAQHEVNVVGPNIESVSIFNSLGQLVKTIDHQGDGVKVDVNALPKGIYIFNLQLSNGKVISNKVHVK
ncbi:PKD repeat protein/arylsulfatase A-like enzyme [Flammeovirga yaeyamensis]|uniref:PKD domain-containing protein n=1 Tax=Flammeovirga yaeyamensis TaxID=367791 RepID=UPI00161F1B54|nr:PKD domain-containing protein [Flammeovirga yaeyamensis]MBB3699913.1 PKD repeat protein/arylsulfatase A-like enzyme [Flammeovirga yaeyamensis]